jgi:hypothetical protein
MRVLLIAAIALAGCGGGDGYEEPGFGVSMCQKMEWCGWETRSDCIPNVQRLSLEFSERCEACILSLTCGTLADALERGGDACDAECG